MGSGAAGERQQAGLHRQCASVRPLQVRPSPVLPPLRLLLPFLLRQHATLPELFTAEWWTVLAPAFMAVPTLRPPGLCSRMLYDYVGAAADCRMRLLRTIAPPAASFEADPARLLRAVRLAARAGLQIEADTAEAMTALATRVAALPHGRLQMELAAQLGYGAAASSVRQLWRFGMLDLLLPHHALYLKVGDAWHERRWAGRGAASPVHQAPEADQAGVPAKPCLRWSSR